MSTSTTGATGVTVTDNGSTDDHMTSTKSTNWLVNAYEAIKGYLPSPTGRLLVEHATNISHEDLSRTGPKNESADQEGSPSFILRNSPGSYPVSDVEDIDEPLELPPAIDLVPLESVAIHKMPENIGTVVEGSIYRSAYPQEEDFAYLQSLGIKSIITLVDTEIPAYDQFIAENGIQHFRVRLPANKEMVKMTDEHMSQALEIVLDRANHPILIHCNKGKHRTGCVVGCFRRVLEVAPEEIHREYHQYAGKKARIWDEAFIEKYDTGLAFFAAVANKWIDPGQPSSPISMKTVDCTVSEDSTALPSLN